MILYSCSLYGFSASSIKLLITSDARKYADARCIMILNSKRKDSSRNYTRLAYQNNILKLPALYGLHELHVGRSTGCILRSIGNKVESEEETRRSAEICWEPRKPQCRVRAFLNKESQLLITQKRFCIPNTLAPIGIPMGHSPDILVDYQTPPCTRRTMDNTFRATP